MTKIQKIWLGVSLGIFLIPELLWNPILNILYSIFKPVVNGSSQIFRSNFLMNSDNIGMLIFIVSLQLLGLLLLLVNLFRINYIKNSSLKYLTILLLLALIIIVCFVLYSLVFLRITLL